LAPFQYHVSFRYLSKKEPCCKDHSGFSKKGRLKIRILKHVVWLLATAFIISGCATYSRNETECNLARTEVNPVWNAEKLDEAFQFACELGSMNLIVATNGEVVKSIQYEKPC
jgi:hypothetical protein